VNKLYIYISPFVATTEN